MSQEYKGRILDPRAFKLSDSTGWIAEVCVVDDVEDEPFKAYFLLKDIFSTEEAALSAALLVAKRHGLGFKVGPSVYLGQVVVGTPGNGVPNPSIGEVVVVGSAPAGLPDPFLGTVEEG